MYKLVNIKKGNKKYDVSFLKEDKFLDFKISEDLLIEFKLFPPKELNEENFQKFLNRLPYDSCLLEGLKYCEKKLRTEKEIREHLFEFVNSESIINEVVESLKKKNLINDEYYFKSFIEYQIDVKMNGRLKIYNEIERLGLEKYSFTYNIDKLNKNIKELSTKYSKKLKLDLPYNDKLLKTKNHLLSKGYTQDDINLCFKDYYIK